MFPFPHLMLLSGREWGTGAVHGVSLQYLYVFLYVYVLSDAGYHCPKIGYIHIIECDRCTRCNVVSLMLPAGVGPC